MIKAIVYSNGDAVAKQIVDEVAGKTDSARAFAAQGNISSFCGDQGFRPEEVLVVFHREKEEPSEPSEGVNIKTRTRSSPSFTMNMIGMDLPPWIDDGVWVSVIHKPERWESMVQQINADYLKNFSDSLPLGRAPWGALPKGINSFSPLKNPRAKIALGRKIDQAMLKIGLVDSLEGAWMPGLDYFSISENQLKVIQKIIRAAFSFKKALATLYKENAWARGILNIGRPAFMHEWALNGPGLDPLKVRLDIAIDEDGIPMVTEMDGTPGGEGFDIGLYHIYREVIGEADVPPSVLEGYTAMTSRLPEGNIMFLITPDSFFYAPEQGVKKQFLAGRKINLVVCEPGEVVISEREVYARGQRVSSWDRFVEGYELKDQKLLELATLSQNGFFTFPGFDSFAWEGKETLALLHLPELKSFWGSQMGSDFETLRSHTPLTLLPSDPRLEFEKKEDWYRKRASSGDNLCWGSRGVMAGKREEQNTWENRLEVDKGNFQEGKFPYHVYQKAVPHKRFNFEGYDRESESIVSKPFNVRLTPFGYNTDQGVKTCGIIATLRDDPRVHGAKDSIQAPCVIV